MLDTRWREDPRDRQDERGRHDDRLREPGGDAGPHLSIRSAGVGRGRVKGRATVHAAIWFRRSTRFETRGRERQALPNSWEAREAVASLGR